MTWPDELTSAPPESPGLMEASSWIRPLRVSDRPLPSLAVMVWSTAVTWPWVAEGVPPAPSALPMATTWSPALTLDESASDTVGRPGDGDRDAGRTVDYVVVGEHLTGRGDDHPSAGRGAIAAAGLDDRVDVDNRGIDLGGDRLRVERAILVGGWVDGRDGRCGGRGLAGLRKRRVLGGVR